MKFGVKNLGKIDRALRITVGVAALLAFAFNYFAAPLSYAALVVGVAMLVTGLWGSCTLYTLLGISTAKK